MKTELKQCPFCGSEHLSIYHDDHVCSCKISCECGCSVEWSSDCMTKEDLEKLVIEKWNTRAYPKEVQKAIERDKPRNPVRPKGYSNIECPTCGAHLKQFYEPEEANVPFCYNCGQRLDWSEECA